MQQVKSLVFEKLDHINSSLNATRQQLQCEFAHAEQLLKEHLAAHPETVTPEGVKISLDLGPDVLQDPFTAEMAGKNKILAEVKLLPNRQIVKLSYLR